jgi:hypothetical protein
MQTEHVCCLMCLCVCVCVCMCVYVRQIDLQISFDLSKQDQWMNKKIFLIINN